jgi:fermentation-respiration switch protein FrsA (DUF1100 family)
VHADHGGTAAAGDGQGVLQDAGQFTRVGDGDGVGAACRGGDASQVGLGLQRDSLDVTAQDAALVADVLDPVDELVTADGQFAGDCVRRGAGRR